MAGGAERSGVAPVAVCNGWQGGGAGDTGRFPTLIPGYCAPSLLPGNWPLTVLHLRGLACYTFFFSFGRIRDGRTCPLQEGGSKT